MAKINRNSGQRGKGRRIQPYAWLGAGALTLGLGAAMASGTAIASADDGSNAGNSGVSHSQNSNASHANRAAKHSSASTSAAGSAARKAQKASGSDTAASADTTAPAATAVSGTAAKSASSRKSVVRSAAATVDAQPAAPDTSAVASPASAPPVNQGQFIPQDITPGAHVALAFDGIDAAKTELNDKTWGADQHPRRSGGDRAQRAAVRGVIRAVGMADAQSDRPELRGGHRRDSDHSPDRAGVPVRNDAAARALATLAQECVPAHARGGPLRAFRRGRRLAADRPGHRGWPRLRHRSAAGLQHHRAADRRQDQRVGQ